MSTGPHLYDEGPAPLHTGPPRSRRGLLLGIFGGTVLVGVGMVALLPLVTGSPDEQARQVTEVFLQATAKGDPETAYGLLCQQERARLTPEQVSSAYVPTADGRVMSVTGTHRGGTRVEVVDVRWTDGRTSKFTVVNEGGARICGTRPVG